MCNNAKPFFCWIALLLPLLHLANPTDQYDGAFYALLMLSICMCSIMTDEMYICLHAYLTGQFINLSFKATIVRQLSWLKPEYIPACQYNLWPKSQARLDLIGSLVPYVTYNLCPRLHCRAGGSVISLGKGCHGNNLWMLRSALCSPHTS